MSDVIVLPQWTRTVLNFTHLSDIDLSAIRKVVIKAYRSKVMCGLLYDPAQLAVNPPPSSESPGDLH